MGVCFLRCSIGGKLLSIKSRLCHSVRACSAIDLTAVDRLSSTTPAAVRLTQPPTSALVSPSTTAGGTKLRPTRKIRYRTRKTPPRRNRSRRDGSLASDRTISVSRRRAITSQTPANTPPPTAATGQNVPAVEPSRIPPNMIAGTNPMTTSIRPAPSCSLRLTAGGHNSIRKIRLGPSQPEQQPSRDGLGHCSPAYWRHW